MMSRCRTYGFLTTSGRRASAARQTPPTRDFFIILLPLLAGEGWSEGSRPSLSEQSIRQENQDEDEDDETKGVLIAETDVDRAERFGQTEDEASEDGARDVSHPAQDRDDEGLGRERSADLRIEVIHGVEQRSRRPDEPGAEPEGDVGDLLRVDPHQRGGPLVLRGGANHPPDVRLSEEEKQSGSEEDRDAEGGEEIGRASCRERV